MKRILAVLLIAGMLVSTIALTGCDVKNKNSQPMTNDEIIEEIYTDAAKRLIPSFDVKKTIQNSSELVINDERKTVRIVIDYEILNRDMKNVAPEAYSYWTTNPGGVEHNTTQAFYDAVSKHVQLSEYTLTVDSDYRGGRQNGEERNIGELAKDFHRYE